MRIGPYEVEQTLAASAAGPARYLARDAAGHTVCVEWRAPTTPAALEAFLSQAQLAAGLRAPGLVPVLGGGQHEGRPYLAWAWVDADPLSERLARLGPLSERAACRMVLALSEALEAAHRRGLVHGFLSPAEVLLHPDGTCQLRGLGLAPLRGQLDPQTAPLEVARHLSPEAAGADDEPPQPSRDVHGLGGLLHALLTGEAPFDGDDTASVLDEVMISRARPPSARVPAGISPQVDAICLRCLETYPRQRYPSCAELSQALRQALGEPAPAEARRPVAAWIAAGLLLAGLALTAAILAAGRPPPPDPGGVPSPPPSTALTPSPRATAQLTDAVARVHELLAGGSFAAAELEADDALVGRPAHAELLWLRGRARAGREAWETARADLRRAVELEPSLSGAWVALAWTLDALGQDPRPALEEALARLSDDDDRTQGLEALRVNAEHDARCARFQELVHVPDADADLAASALLIASLGPHAPDPELALRRLDRWARELRRQLDDGAPLLPALGELLRARTQAPQNDDPAGLYLDRALAGGPAYPTLRALIALELGRRAERALEAWSLPETVLIGEPTGERFLELSTAQVLPRGRLLERWPAQTWGRLGRGELLMRLIANLARAYQRDEPLRQLGALRLLEPLVPDADRTALTLDQSTLEARLGLHRRAAEGLARVVEDARARGVPMERVAQQLTRSRSLALERWTR